MKITNDVLTELRKIRAAIDDAYDKLNVTLYEKNNAVKVKYNEVKPVDKVTENFGYIATQLKLIEESEIVGDE